MKVISTDKAPAAIGPYSQALEVGNMLYLSGQIPVDPQTGALAESIEEQTKQVFANIQAVLHEAGLDLSHVVKTLVFLSDLSDFAAMNAIYESFLTKPYPARSCVQVAGIPKGAKVEIECIAVRTL